MNAHTKGPFSSLHARALCHATEALERVEQAMLTVVGEAELEIASTHGHHGNEIRVLEAHLKGGRQAAQMIRSLSCSDVDDLQDTIERRMDDSCNLFLRLDKQKALAGEVTLAESDDAIAVRIKVAAYPARKPIAIQAVRGFIAAMACE